MRTHFISEIVGKNPNPTRKRGITILTPRVSHEVARKQPKSARQGNTSSKRQRVGWRSAREEIIRRPKNLDSLAGASS